MRAGIGGAIDLTARLGAVDECAVSCHYFYGTASMGKHCAVIGLVQALARQSYPKCGVAIWVHGAKSAKWIGNGGDHCSFDPRNFITGTQNRLNACGGPEKHRSFVTGGVEAHSEILLTRAICWFDGGTD
jgi:hypothetical protein